MRSSSTAPRRCACASSAARRATPRPWRRWSTPCASCRARSRGCEPCWTFPSLGRGGGNPQRGHCGGGTRSVRLYKSHPQSYAILPSLRHPSRKDHAPMRRRQLQQFRSEAFSFVLVGSVLLLLSSVGCAQQSAAASNPSLEPPPAPREFRGVWVATVGNIDWPSKPGLSTADQQAEAIRILDKAAELNMNAVVFQVRPACDAMYESKIEPWSYFLTGKQGQPPSPYYDPLKFWIVESHKRGLELHAWFNPYRAHLAGEKTPIAANHISKTNPRIVKQYGEFEWLDPGEKASQDQTYNVVMDIAKRYDVDGLHIDDYFYPYKVKKF